MQMTEHGVSGASTNEHAKALNPVSKPMSDERHQAGVSQINAGRLYRTKLGIPQITFSVL